MATRRNYITKSLKHVLVFAVLFLSSQIPSIAQDEITKKPAPFSCSSKLLNGLQKKYSGLQNSVEKQSAKMLQRMQQKEGKLKSKLKAADSTKAKELFTNGTQEQYQELQTKMQGALDITSNNIMEEYIPGIDSLQTALDFYLKPAGDKEAGQLPPIGAGKLAELQELSNRLRELQGRLQQAKEVQSFIREREALLKEKLANTDLSKQLASLNKEVVYYQQRLNDYKDLLNNKDKLKGKLLGTVRTLPGFQKFWQRNSMLAQMFPMPAEGADPATALAGLQSRAGIQQLLGQRFGIQALSGRNGNMGALQQQIENAQSKLNILQEKLGSSLKSGQAGNSDITQPDFKPNEQKTKSFFQRLQYGFNIQNQRGNSFLPATSDIALTLGYKLSSKATMGIGTSYKMGWGNGWKDIKLTNEGFGIRSNLDVKVKGDFWLSGGFEYNYMQSFKSLAEIYSSYKLNISPWQNSGLIGVSKKYSIASPLKGSNKASKKKAEGSIQLLYDFLAARNPGGQALVIRAGWSF